MNAHDVISVIAAEAGGRTPAARFDEMLSIASTIANRATATGATAKSIISAPAQYQAYGRPMPPGTKALMGMAEKAWSQVMTRGPVTPAQYYATHKTVGNLPKGLSPVGKTAAHSFFTDPKGRAVATAAGYKSPTIGRSFAVTPAIGPTPTSRAVSPVEARGLLAGRFGPTASGKMADAKSQAKTESRISTAFGVTGRPMALADPAAVSKAVAAAASRYSDPATGRVAAAFSNVGKAAPADPSALSKAVASYKSVTDPVASRMAAAFAPGPSKSTPAAVAALAGLAARSSPSVAKSAPSPGIAAAMADMGKGMRSQGVLGLDGKIEGRLAEARAYAANPTAYRSQEATGRVAAAHGRAPTASIANPEALGRAVASIAGRMAPVALGPAMTAPVAMTPALSRGPVATMSRAPTMTTMARAPVSVAPTASRGTAPASPIGGLLGLLSGVFGPTALGGLLSEMGSFGGDGGNGGGMGGAGQAGIGGFGVGGQSGHDYSGR